MKSNLARYAAVFLAGCLLTGAAMILQDDWREKQRQRDLQLVELGQQQNQRNTEAQAAERVEQAKAEQQRKALYDHNRAAIVAAFRQISTGLAAVKDIKSTSLQETRWLQYCNKLSFPDCPENFRLAWWDYVTALQTKKKDEGRVVFDIVGAIVLPETVPIMAHKAVENAEAISKDDPDFVFRGVLRFAIQYSLTAKDLEGP